MSTPYVVNGAGNGVYPRLEIADLMNDEYQFSLFMQAISRIQNKDYQPKPASWQEIVGGAETLKVPAMTKTQKDGEQAVCNEARNIASTINQGPKVGADEKALWNDASQKLRFPFWDWSAPIVQQNGLPTIFETPSVTVRGPGGTQITLDRNPIKSYTFAPIPAGATNDNIAGMDVRFKDWTQTYRWATGRRNETQDNVQELNEALEDGVEIQGVEFTSDARIRQKLSRIFSFPQTAPQELWGTYTDSAGSWDYFSNTSPQAPSPSDAATIAAIEEPHNWVHLTLGGDGDMSFNDLAAFDPIFFFHHCNVDRLYALWEYVYPDYWLGQGYYDEDGNLNQFVDQQGTYQEQPGTALTEDSELAPFRKADGSYWTPADVRGLQPGQGQNKYYCYPPMNITFNGPSLGGPTQPREGPEVPAGSGSGSSQVVIDVTKPATAEQRAQYLAALQQFYGDATLAQASRPLAKPALFNSPAVSFLQTSALAAVQSQPVRTAPAGVANAAAAPHIDAVKAAPHVDAIKAAPPAAPATAPRPPLLPPPTHQPLVGFRDFVVTGALPQFAFRGSHRLALHLDGLHVANLSVLSRLDPARCANCQGRVAAGRTHVRGVMALPHAHVVRLLEKHGLNREDAGEDEVVGLLKRHISAQIVTPVGTVLAEATHEASVAVPEGGAVFKAEDHPVLHLHSSRVFVATPQHRQPRVHEGWVHHGAVLKDQWKFSSA
ncbi:hypothetical protein EIP86_006958 [Pleurotus ostreatoroseus]|nr:hypothetical protein EIP86_006958 [Pleurotus ostreatoroseus]